MTIAVFNVIPASGRSKCKVCTRGISKDEWCASVYMHRSIFVCKDCVAVWYRELKNWHPELGEGNGD